MIKKETWKINGTHCRGCKILLETELNELGGVKKANVNHVNGVTKIEFDDNIINRQKIYKLIRKLNYQPRLLEENGGTKENKNNKTKTNNSFWLGLLVPLGVILLGALYFWLDSLGGFALLAELNETRVGYGLIFIIGLLAGFHCIGMCGGLVVAYSAACVRQDKNTKWTSHLQYNLARLTSYTIIGGILGGIGSFFAVNPSFTGAVIIIASIFMVLMGLSFIYKWPILEKLKLRTPDFIARFLYSNKTNTKPKGPIIIGLLNGFMPCGPLQAMQLYALTSGSMTHGALSMAVYALGTIPLMFGLGTIITRLADKYLMRIFKFSGVVIIILGIFMANRGLANFGLGLPNISLGADDKIAQLSETEEFQTVNMDLTYLGYQPNVLYIKPDIPVRWVINAKQMTGCTDAIMIESLGIERDLVPGENIIEFTPPSGVDEIKFSCWMRMVWGKFVITEDAGTKEAKAQVADTADLPKSTCSGNGSCGGTCSGSCGCSNK